MDDINQLLADTEKRVAEGDVPDDVMALADHIDDFMTLDKVMKNGFGQDEVIDTLATAAYELGRLEVVAQGKREDWSWVSIVTPGATHCINLFYGEHCAALVQSSDAVEKLKNAFPEKSR